MVIAIFQDFGQERVSALFGSVVCSSKSILTFLISRREDLWYSSWTEWAQPSSDLQCTPFLGCRFILTYWKLEFTQGSGCVMLISLLYHLGLGWRKRDQESDFWSQSGQRHVVGDGLNSLCHWWLEIWQNKDCVTSIVFAHRWREFHHRILLEMKVEISLAIATRDYWHSLDPAQAK